MRTRAAVVALSVAAAGCGRDKPAGGGAATTGELWPGAPEVERIATVTVGYRPEALDRYRYSIDMKSLPGSAAPLSVEMKVLFELTPGRAARSRDVRLRDVDLAAGTPGELTRMRLGAGDVLVVERNGQTARVGRGQDGPLDVALLLDEPVTTLTFAADGRVTSARNPRHPLAAGDNDSIDNLLVLFPDLPAGDVQPGDRWQVRRRVALSSAIAPVDVRFELHALGEARCPSGAPACAVVALEAEGTATSRGWEVDYRFDGRLYQDSARGALDEARVRMRVEASLDGATIALGARYAMKVAR